MYELMQGDCLVEMNRIADGSIDAIICDLPYGTTACAWDSVIPFEPLWKHYKRVIKPSGAIVLFGQQPFTTKLISSNMDWFRYSWVWIKNRVTGHANSNKMPMKNTEDVCVFYRELPTYNPQGLKPCHIDQRRKDKRYAGLVGIKQHGGIQTLTGYPQTTIDRISAVFDTEHQTQKPVALLEYLIRTYTNEGETVLDNCFGSGSCGVAAMRTKRRFIGIEKEAEFFAIGSKQIADAARAAAGLPKVLTGNPADFDGLPMFAQT